MTASNTPWIAVAIFPTRTYRYECESREDAEAYARMEETQELCIGSAVIEPDGSVSLDDAIGLIRPTPEELLADA